MQYGGGPSSRRGKAERKQEAHKSIKWKVRGKNVAFQFLVGNQNPKITDICSI